MMRCSTLDSTGSINCLVVIVIVIVSLTSPIFADAVKICSVEPTIAVVTSGEAVILNCTVHGDFPIHTWQVGTQIERKHVVYSPPTFSRNGNVTRHQILADGYSVTNVADNKTSLHMNKIKFSQAGLYVCECGDTSRSTASTAVVVLASEPQFTVIPSIVTSGKPVSFACNISFNGSADVSSNLTIKDVAGTMVNSTVCYSNSRLTSCVLNHTITANASVNQSYICSVQLNTNNTMIYSRVVNTSLDWKRVTSAEIVISNPSKCSAQKCVVSESITCKTDENSGITVYKWWQIQSNGSRLQLGDNGQNLMLTKTGQFMYECQAYSTIRGINYNATSKTFAIDVMANDKSVSGFTTTMLVVIGISVAIGIVIVVIAIFVTCICCSRKQKNRQNFRAINTDESSVPPPHRQPTNRYDKTKVRDPGQQQGSASTSSNHPAASSKDNKLFENETVLFDNDLYGGARCASPDPVAPSVPEENIYNEIHTLN